MSYGIIQCYRHLVEVSIPPLPPAKAYTRFSNLGRMQGWVDLLRESRLGTEPATCQSQVQCTTAVPPCNTCALQH